MTYLRRYPSEICIFLILLACYSYFFPRWADWNQNSRLDLTLAIVETGGLSIDAYHVNTGDKLYFAGHYYSDKAPGLSFLAVPVYAVLHPILTHPVMAPLLERVGGNAALEETLNPGGTGVKTQKIYFALAQYGLTLILIGLPSALLGVLLYRFLARLVSELGPRVVAVLAYGLGTAAFPYSWAFYSHQLAAALGFLAFFLAFRVRRENAPQWHLWLVGLLLGCAVITEYPMGLIALVVGLYVVLGLRDRWAVLSLALAAVPPMLVWMAYNLARFGAPLEFGYQYHATFARHAQSGFAGLAGFRWQALWDLTFSLDKGLFFRSPFLLLALPGWILLWRDGRYRAEVWCSIFAVVTYTLSASSFYDWGGGHTAGPRYLVAVLPFLVFPTVSMVRSRHWRWLAVISAGLSMLLVGAEALAGQHFPYQELNNPWSEYIWPSWQAGDVARNLGMVIGLFSWFSLAPLFVAVGGLLWLLFGRAGPQFSFSP